MWKCIHTTPFFLVADRFERKRERERERETAGGGTHPWEGGALARGWGARRYGGFGTKSTYLMQFSQLFAFDGPESVATRTKEPEQNLS